MPTLSSILVQRGAVTMRAVEDAIARQVFHGGDLATNLLEVGAIREDVLAPVLAESLELPPAPAGRLPAPSARVLRLVPGELALRHGIFPLEQEDRRLVVATAEPLSASVEDDLGFALDLAIRQVVAPLVRIRQAIAEHYGIPLERRFLRLVARLDGQADPSPSAAPPAGHDLLPVKMPRPISIPGPSFGTGVPSAEPDARLLDERPAPKTPFVAAHEFVNPAIPKSPPVPADAVPVGETPATPAVTAGPQAAQAGPAVIAEPVPVLAAGPHDATATAFAVTEPALAAPKRAEPDARALAGVVRQALRAERATAPVDKTKRDGRPAWRPAHRRKGPFTAAMAERELEEAAASDAVLEIVFAFAQQFFEYAALFVVQGDLAEGRDASGPGADRSAILGIALPLDLPSSLARARERRAPVIGRLDGEGLDADLARDLGRAPHAVALLPVTVRTRVVAILYGDDGAVDVELSSIGEVLAMIGLAGAALERIALRRKFGNRAPEIPLKVRIVEATPPPAETRAQGVAALARMVTGGPEATPARTPTPSPAAVRSATPAPVTMGPQAAPYPAAPGAPAAVREPTPTPGRAVQMFSPVVPADDDAAFGVSPPDDDAVLPPSQGPRTARYFGDQGAALPPPAPVPSPRAPAHDADGIQFPEAATPTPPPVEEVFGDSDAPADRLDSWLPVSEAPAAPPPAARKAGPAPTRRGLAPTFEGRASRSPMETGFEPLPSTPPPNATAWTSFPSLPPPEAILAPRARSERPIPREEGAPAEAPRVDHAALPSVVVDVGAEYQSLVQRVIDGSHDAFEELVRSGEHAVQAVMARFPGPLRVDRHRARAELPAASQCGPILELVVAIRRPALPFVSGRLSSPDPEVRFWATHVLGELRYAEAATALLPRLFDDDAHVRRVARRSAAALVSAGAAGEPILKGLDDITRSAEEPVTNRVTAIETMGEIRSGSMVPSLARAVEDPSEEIAEAARRALLVITRQDFGRDGPRWQEWWARNGGRHRIEWLIDALMHDQPSLRRAAGDELKLLTKEYFGYYDDLPRRERERAQALYRAWWDREGKARFS